MYSNSDDPVVTYYDFTLALCPGEEVRFYVEAAVASGGPVLDLACGTGILGLEAAKRGVALYGVDTSLGMIEVFRRKLAEAGSPAADRVRLIHAPMSDFTLPEKAVYVFCRDAFFHNLTPEDERRTLDCVNRCLAAGGVFAFNLPNPNHQFLSWASSEESSAFHERRTYPVPGSGRTITINQKLEIDLKAQGVSTTLQYLTKNEKGETIQTEYSGWRTRYLYPHEIFYLLELCGFTVKNVFGNYDQAPYDWNTMLVIEAVKK